MLADNVGNANDEGPDQTDVDKWIRAFTAYDREFNKWESRSQKIIKRYKDDRGAGTAVNNTAKINVLWSNVQVLIPAVYARTPKPDVSRRFRDTDAVGRVASLILERALEFEIDHYPDYCSALKNAVFDRFMGGRGVAWVRYEPHFRAAEIGSPQDGFQITEDADESEVTPESQEELDYECAPVDYVHWKDFGHTISRTWEEVTAVWRKCYMNRNGLIERFGEEIGSKIPLDTRPDDIKKNGNVTGEEQFQALIYEVWDKSSNQAIWISKSMNQILDARPDPLGLENFFPCPKPLYATLTTDNLIPTPDFSLYQDQAREMDMLAEKIERFIDQLSLKGVYDAAVPELSRLFAEAGNGDLIPVKNWMAFAEKNGLRGAIDLIDIGPIVNALNESFAAADKLKRQIDEISGVSDLLRGSSEANETATAQSIKGQFGTLRLRSMQRDVVAFATDILCIKAQIMSKLFQPQTLLQISAAMQMSQADQQLIPQAIQLIQDNPLRNFRIEVSSDSMMQLDENQEKKDRMEFLGAVSGFLEKMIPAAQATPQIAPMLAELLKYGVTGFKVGKSLEGVIDGTIDQLTQQASQPQQPKPDPEMQKVQAQTALAQQQFQMKTQADQQAEANRQQFEQQKLQMEAQLDEKKAQLQAQVEQHKQMVQAQQIQHQNELEAQRLSLQHQNEMQLKALQIQADERSSSAQLSFDRWKAELDAAVRLEVAGITSKKTVVDPATVGATKTIAESFGVPSDGPTIQIIPDSSGGQPGIGGGIDGDGPEPASPFNESDHQ